MVHLSTANSSRPAGRPNGHEMHWTSAERNDDKLNQLRENNPQQTARTLECTLNAVNRHTHTHTHTQRERERERERGEISVQ